MIVQKTLYLSYDGMTDPLGQSQVLPYLTGLSKKGFQVHLISCEKPKAYAANAGFIRQICLEAGIEWYPIRYTKKPALLSTLFDIWQMWKKSNDIHKNHGIELVHCRSYIAAITGARLKRKYGLKFVFDMRGFWPDERLDGNLWNLKNPLYKQVYRFFKRREQDFLEDADHTICLTKEAEKEIHSWSHIRNNPVPITVIPCCVDLDHFDPDKISEELKAQWRVKLGISPDDRIISYVGSVGTWYMPDEMLDFFAVFLQQIPSAHFLFITRDEPGSILEKAKQKGIDPRKIIVQAGSRQDMPVLISLSHYSLFFIKPAYSKKASSPTKQGEIMRLGIPIICNDLIGDTSYVVKKYKAGVVLEAFNIESYKEAVSLLLETTFDAKNSVNGAFEFYNLESGVERYDRIYRDLLDLIS